MKISIVSRRERGNEEERMGNKKESDEVSFNLYCKCCRKDSFEQLILEGGFNKNINYMKKNMKGWKNNGE
ncbi:hypothetical protein BpHYR1_030575 [Brachionus plicatilis]|uniref:Uncharacterized protein n=1 Tax=Brachionus plicatilis TaxID=10195 RepID=A0A3M7SR18_BRAPC|nr:hypothetical protein BpHYR1_030575 [Brachionus plicatilis]